MAEYPGNAIPSPGYASGTHTVDDELLFSTVGYTQKGVTLKPGQGVLLLGTVLKQDASTKQYVKVSGGDEANAEGLLRQTTDTGTDANGQVWQANIVLTGLAKLPKVQSANSGVTLTSVLDGRVNSVIGFFKF